MRRRAAGQVRRNIARILTSALLLAVPGAALGQSADTSNASSALSSNLPRPGYEPRTLRFGTTTLAVEVGLETRYDSNVFAVSVKPIDDVIFLLTPRLTLDGEYGQLKLKSEVFADIREYADNGSESQATFGIATSGKYTPGRGHSLSGGARVERFVESRNDPEANTRLGLSPRLVNAVSANLAYGFQRNRLGLDLRGEIQHLGYVPPEDAERSLTTLYTAARVSFIASPRLAVFVQPYVNRRNHDQPLDNSGVDRDITTLGVIAGARLSIADRWNGEVGVGAFRANPDDVSLRSFSGLAANANLVWSPAARTSVTLRGSSGDTATVRAGAIGRADLRASLRIDQEIRHNLLFAATVGYQETRYRGLPNQLRTAFVSAQAEYLLNRVAALFFEVNYARRRANPATDGFNRGYVGIGIRLRH